MVLQYEEHVISRLHHCVIIIKSTCTNLDGIAYYCIVNTGTPCLFGRLGTGERSRTQSFLSLEGRRQAFLYWAASPCWASQSCPSKSSSGAEFQQGHGSNPKHMMVPLTPPVPWSCIGTLHGHGHTSPTPWTVVPLKAVLEGWEIFQKAR